jgi:hypothetical protein
LSSTIVTVAGAATVIACGFYFLGRAELRSGLLNAANKLPLDDDGVTDDDELETAVTGI